MFLFLFFFTDQGITEKNNLNYSFLEREKATAMLSDGLVLLLLGRKEQLFHSFKKYLANICQEHHGFVLGNVQDICLQYKIITLL